ncbi:MAG: DUF721 domain-containing protein [Rickettsiales bacterium]|jgi:hypothetical protein|nr:DUF721 domain-containing protein [Rickettsiales bacterium]
MQKIDFFTNKILNSILKGYSPVMLTLHRNWKDIIGVDYYKICAPEKIVFVKGKRNFGTLYVKIYNSVPLLFINSDKKTIIERINTVFGDNIVKDIKIKQFPTLPSASPQSKN